jgi:hypothetical protein
MNIEVAQQNIPSETQREKKKCPTALSVQKCYGLDNREFIVGFSSKSKTSRPDLSPIQSSVQ